MEQHYLLNLEATIKRKWDQPALCFFQGEELSFGQVAGHIARFHLFFKENGIAVGDKIAICAKNTHRWAVSFLSVTTYGTVIVPILADFHPDSVNYLVDHSDSLMLFTDREIWNKLDPEKMPKVRAVINCDDFELLFSRDKALTESYRKLDETFKAAYPQGFGP